MYTLNELPQGASAIITKVRGRGAFRRRIMEMGFVAGKKLTTVRKAPLQDPVEYNIMGYNVTLRNSEAALIEIKSIDPEFPDGEKTAYSGTFQEGEIKTNGIPKSKQINVALVGNPNSGKTTLFNQASGSHEKVGNYSGVTVSAKEAIIKHKGYTIVLTDLPGTYSITSYTPEEVFVRNHILNQLPDVVLNIVDSSNLERNLYLTTQLIDMDTRVVMALNMYDELQKKGDELNHVALGKLLGIPMVPTIGSKGRGITELLDRIIEVYEDRDPIVRHIHVNYGPVIEKSIRAIQEPLRLPANSILTDQISSRFLAIKLLEKDKVEIERAKICVNADEVLRIAAIEQKRIESLTSESAESCITDAKYGFIHGALKETIILSPIQERRTSEIIDTFITHKVFGLPVFVFLMWLMFEATFTLGSYPMSWIEYGMDGLANIAGSTLNEGMFKDLLVNGIIGGIGGVIVFLPNILLLFFFISLMEDTGYMARAVFIMDKIMHKIGLHGKSFIPLLMGFGCTVPAIMATRTLENRNDRLITMLINPFISCSARLPVYILLISAFFPGNSGTILFLIYSLGVFVAVITALLLKKTMFKAEQVPFVMELPPYRIPTSRVIVSHMWDKAVQYLQKIGGVILIASIIIWALGYFPTNVSYSQDYNAQIKELQSSQNLEGNKNIIHQLELKRKKEKQEQSYISSLGKLIEPAIAPLGFDWKMGISIIAGVAGKEIVVSTMGVLYESDITSDEIGNSNLVSKLQTQVHTEGKRKGLPVFTSLTAISFMIFVLLYFPCMSTIVVIANESGSWKWGMFAIIYTSGIAWLASFVVYQGGLLLGMI
ncbi:MAG: ferrous iron transport protein B [Bacteroidales bacterium]|nr:ferrous iron transport protein B [Bacteroidales bacterium]